MKEICVGDKIRYKGKWRDTLSYMNCCDNAGYFIRLPRSEGGWKASETSGSISDHVAEELQNEYIHFINEGDVEDFEEKMRRPAWTFVADRDNKKIALIKTTQISTATELLKNSHSFSSSTIFQQDELHYNSTVIAGGEGSCVEHVSKHLLSYDDEMAKAINFTKDTNFKELIEREDVLVLDENGLDIKELTIKEYSVNEKGVKATVVESGKTMAKAGLLGVKLASVGKAQEAAYNKLVQHMVSSFGINRKTLEDPKIRALIMAFLPLALHPVATVFDDRLPHADKVRAICELSMTETSRKHSDQIIGFAYEMFQIMAEASTPSAIITAPLAVQQTKQRIDVDYGDFDVKSLRGIAKKRQVRIPSKARRAQIVKLLEESDQSEQEGELLELENQLEPRRATL